MPARSVIPRPVRMETRNGQFTLRASSSLEAAPKQKAVADGLASLLRRATGYPLPVRVSRAGSGRPNTISLLTETALPDEAYRLSVQPDRVVVHASGPAGTFYACQTLRQLLPDAVESRASSGAMPWTIPRVEIEDAPRFGWRGFMLDSSRHFQTKPFVTRLIDALAFFKINRLHWHLVDNEGWRIESRRHPQLNGPAADNDPKGYYTQDDLREILAYAEARHVGIYPEIEMPGHSRRLLSVMKELRCANAEGNVEEVCLGSGKVTRFFRGVLDEVLGLFPDCVIHVGGDEAGDQHWKKCPKCRARMKREGLAQERLLQKSFMQEMTDYLHRQGRRTISWADQQDLGWPEGQIVQGWHKGESEYAIAHGMSTVHSVHDYTYFDYPDGPTDTVRAPWMIELPIERVYAFDPVPPGATPEQASLVLGSEACLWTENVNESGVWAKTFPRLLAFSEVVWSPQAARQWRDFEKRMPPQFKRLEAMGILRKSTTSEKRL